MNSNSRFVWFMVIAAAIGIGLVVAVQFRSNEPLEIDDGLALANKAPKKIAPPNQSLEDALGVEPEELVEVGGVKRPLYDVVQPKQTNALAARSAYLDKLPKVGRITPVPNDANATVTQLAEEIKGSKEQSHPAKSVFVTPAPFDREKYEQDKSSYLTAIRPGRVFQSLQPGADVPVLKNVSPLLAQIVQGESVLLSVDAEPGMPVTFHTRQLGEMDNRLKTITVAANEQGLAKATYRSGPGVRGMVTVMAASPVMAGRIDFKINVSLPQ